MKTNNLYNQITNEIVKQLEAGIVPWQKPWQNGTFMGCVSHTSGKPYSLLNQWLLNYRSGEYLTYKQIQAEGGRVKAGENANIFPYTDEANILFNSNLCYETALLKKYAEPLLKEIEPDAPQHSEAVRLLEWLKFYDVVYSDIW